MAVAVMLPSVLVAPIAVIISPTLRSLGVSVLTVATWVVDDIVTVLVLPAFVVMVNVAPSSEATVPTVGGVPVRPEPPPAPELAPEASAPLGVAAERRPAPFPPNPGLAFAPVSVTRVAASWVPVVVPVTLT